MLIVSDRPRRDSRRADRTVPENLAAYTVPRKMVFVCELPLGPSGKVLTPEFRDVVRSV